jgi:hypothetical protein
LSCPNSEVNQKYGGNSYIMHLINIYLIFLWFKVRYCIYLNGFYVLLNVFVQFKFNSLIEFSSWWLLKINKEKLEMFIRKAIPPFQKNLKFLK